MRKELICYVATTEKGIEASVRAYAGDPSGILIEHEGHKFAIPTQALKEAIEQILNFYSKKDKPRGSKIEDQLKSINSILGKKKDFPIETDEEYIKEFKTEYGIYD